MAEIQDTYAPSDAEAAEERDEDEEQSPSQDDERILEQARKRFALAKEAEAEIRREALDDLKFLVGDQWDSAVKAAREQDRRPCLTINRLPQHLQQVTNDQRQNRPSLKVHPVDDSADPETAKVIQGIFRHIEYNSSADTAYDTAFEGAAGPGLGYFRALTEYADPLSFEQEIVIKRIRDRFSVYFDPHSQEPDGSDADFAFIVDQIKKEDYEARYGESKLAASGGWAVGEDSAPDWVQKDSVQIAEYFYKEYKTETIYQLSNGQVLREAELAAAQLPEGVEIVRDAQGKPVSRMARVPEVRWCKINGTEILERTTLPGFWIPVIPVYGAEHIVDGKRILKGIIRDAKDAQRQYNYLKSAETEAIALAPKAPFVAEEHQLEGYEADWQTANQRNHAFLKYKAWSNNGTPLPPPQRMAVEPAVGAIVQAAMGAAEDLKSTTGIYDAALGARSNETSGIAIQRRANQAQTSNFHFVDNLTRSMKHLGRILIAWIPSIYDTQRTVRIIGEDGEQKRVTVNGPQMENGQMVMGKDGKPVIYDLSVGRYDVTVDVGPSYASKRQEAAASMMEFAKAVPQVAQIAADLIAKNMDWPGASDIAERIKKTLPPGLADDGKQSPVPPQIKAQMEQMGQMVESLTGKLHELQDEKEQKLLELESRERIEFKKLEVQLEIERAKLDAKDSLALLNAEIAQIERRLSILNVQAPINTDGGPEAAPQMAAPDQASPAPDGAPMSADVSGDGMNPTGGEPPGQTPGEIHDDPNAF